MNGVILSMVSKPGWGWEEPAIKSKAKGVFQLIWSGLLTLLYDPAGLSGQGVLKSGLKTRLLPVLYIVFCLGLAWSKATLAYFWNLILFCCHFTFVSNLIL